MVKRQTSFRRDRADAGKVKHKYPGKDFKDKDLVAQPWRLALALQRPFYAGQIKDERDRVWLAAMIDGEGCFFIHKRKAGTRSYSRFTRADGSVANYTRTADTFGVGLEISNTNKAIIDRVHAICGGTVTTQSPTQNRRRKQTIYRWRCPPNEARRIAQEVYPYLVGKQHQARLIYSCPSNGDAAAAAHQAMMDLHNGVATAIDYPEPPSLFEPGFYLRQDIIWAKRNAMPESVRDRCTKAHEYIFLLAKSERYYYNAEALKEPSSPDTHARYARATAGYAPPGQDKHEGLLAPRENLNRVPSGWNAATTGRRHDDKVGRYQNSPKYEGAGEEHRSKMGLATAAERYKPSLRKLAADSRDAKANASFDQAMRDMPETRNKRSVWTISTEPYKGAHFATFPTEIPRNAILAGSRPGDTVLDPFMGSGTTAQVALELHRHVVGIDLDERNRALMDARLSGLQIGVPLDIPVQEAA